MMDVIAREEQNLSWLWLIIFPGIFFHIPVEGPSTIVQVVLPLLGGIMIGLGGYLFFRHCSKRANIVALSLTGLFTLGMMIFQ